MKEEILELIIKLTGYEDLKNNIDIDLIEEDILDSLSFIQLISELEEKYNIEIQPTQVPGDIWRSVDRIVEMVKEKMNSNGEWFLIGDGSFHEKNRPQSEIFIVNCKFLCYNKKRKKKGTWNDSRNNNR